MRHAPGRQRPAAVERRAHNSRGATCRHNFPPFPAQIRLSERRPPRSEPTAGHDSLNRGHFRFIVGSAAHDVQELPSVGPPFVAVMWSTHEWPINRAVRLGSNAPR
jgi:hypothetical protein